MWYTAGEQEMSRFYGSLYKQEVIMEVLKAFDVRHDDGGTEKITIRHRISQDFDQAVAFYQKVPPEENIHFDEDITNPTVIKGLFNPAPDHEYTMLVALRGAELIGECLLRRRLNKRSDHVAEIRTYVLPEYRHLGIGFTMVKEMLFIALRKNIEKIYGKVPSLSLPYFEDLALRLGFQQEAVLAGHVKDIRGKKHDLIFFAQNLNALWDTLSDWQAPYGRAMEY